MGHAPRPPGSGGEPGHAGEARPGAGLLVDGLWRAGSGGEETDEEEVAGLPPASERRAPGDRRGPERPRGRGPRRYLPSRVPFRGRHVRALPARGRHRDLAWEATLRAAALRQRRLPLTLQLPDLRRKQRLVRSGRLLLFVTDISGSMGGELMQLARRIALLLLQDAYVRRDRVAMIAFTGQRAELLFGPTNQARQVRRALSRLTRRCGGTTPLPAALHLARRTLRSAALTDPGREPLLILISDGRANVGSRPGYAALVAELEAAARALASAPGLRILFLDTTERGKADLAARELADALGARRIVLSRLRATGEDLAVAVSEIVKLG